MFPEGVGSRMEVYVPNHFNRWRERLRGDFKNFLYVVWKRLGLPSPTKVQYEIADWLQHGPRRKIVEAFRGVGKSWTTSAYVLWRLDRDPDEKFLVVSASKARSDDFTTFTKRLINEIDFLNYLKAKEGQRDSMVAFDVGPAKPAHAPSVKSVGIFGQLTGSRATEVIADDVEVPNNSMTQDMRDKLLKTCLEFEAIIVPDIGRITYLGTPQTEESIYNKLRERGYVARIWPARYPSPEKIVVYGDSLAPSIVEAVEKNPSLAGKPTDPERFSEIDLIEREAAYGRSGFALQFMLDTSLSDADRYPLKLADLLIMHLDPEKAPVSLTWSSAPEFQIKELPNVGFTGDRFYRPWRIDDQWAPYEGSVMAIDPSGRGADELAYAVVKQLHGYLFVTAVGGLKGGYEDHNLVKLAQIAREQKVNYVVYEANFGDGMFGKIFAPILARYWPCTIEEVKHSVQKEKRIIDTLEPVMNRHRLVIDYRCVEQDIKETKDDPNYSLFYQMTRITRERGALKHDDRLDALAIAVNYWVEAMARDEKIALQDYRDKLLEAELETFMAYVVGRPVTDNDDIRSRILGW